MAIGTLTMILANVGLSIFNNWAGSRQNKQIADKREEFERAARDGQRERMLRLMREGQELTLQMEEEKHQERLQELNDQFDNLIKEMTYSAVIDHWPLKTLPIVMKNQALGNLLAKQEERVALHCILTPSNCYDFNQYVLPKVESALEEYCNLYWSNLSGNPILFYSGAWNGNDAPTGTQVASLQTALSNLPSLLITPYFRPTDGKLVFQVYTWGVGSNHQDQFTIPVIEPTEFQRDYTNALNWPAEDHLIEDAVEDLVPYLQCMIGYIADTYFWSAFGSVSQLPRMLTDGTINTDGMKYLVDDCYKYFNNLLEVSEGIQQDNIFSENTLVALFDGLSSLLNEEEQRRGLRKLFVDYCSTNKKITETDPQVLINEVPWNLNDLRFISQVTVFAGSHNLLEYQGLTPVVEMLSSIDYDYSILDDKDYNRLEALANAGNAVALYRLGEIYEYGMRVSIDDDKAQTYYQQSADKCFLFAEIKTGMIQYNDILVKTEGILRSMNILQLDVLFSDQIIKTNSSDTIIDDAIERLSKTIMSNIMTGRAYSHAGLLYNLAILKLKKKDYQTAKSMAGLALKLGYTKASELI